LRKRVLSIIVIITILSILSSAVVFWEEIYSLYGYSKAALSYYGSTGQEVKNIQYKLQLEVLQWQNRRNLRLQDLHGGPQIPGQKRPEGGRNSGSGNIGGFGTPYRTSCQSNIRQPSSNRNLDLLAHLVYGEARGEPYIGQVAVAAVVINRTRDSRFPNTIAGVIYQPGAFDAVSDGQINLAPMKLRTKLQKTR